MDHLNGFQRDLLYVIAGMDEPHGLAIKEELDDYYETDLNHGRLYPNLDILAEMGLVNKGTKDSRTNAYTITSDGEAVLRDRNEWVEQYISE